MTEYAAGTVAEVTWDNASLAKRQAGESDVKTERAIRTADGRWSLESGWDRCIEDAYVTDVRPLIVLDLDESFGKSNLPTWLRNNVGKVDEGCVRPSSVGQDMLWLADQIEAQTKPPRIPEPGLWGVVRSLAGFEWVRVGPNQQSSREWLCENGARADWDELGSPVLIRPGIEDES